MGNQLNMPISRKSYIEKFRRSEKFLKHFLSIMIVVFCVYLLVLTFEIFIGKPFLRGSSTTPLLVTPKPIIPPNPISKQEL